MISVKRFESGTCEICSHLSIFGIAGHLSCGRGILGVVERGCMIKGETEKEPIIWKVYMILCSDQSLYTGITTDITRRFDQHATGRGAKYFRGRTPDVLVYLESGHNRSSASQREAAIKKLSVKAKHQLINTTSAPTGVS
jgi:putative endonuclease